MAWNLGCVAAAVRRWNCVGAWPAIRCCSKGGDAHSPTQDVSYRRTAPAFAPLGEADLFAYVCVHGAGHGWSRLKWLADLNALIAQKSEADIERLYNHARATGSGICAGLALLLCHRLLGLSLPARLEQEFRGNKRLDKLVAIVMNVMAGPDAATELEDRRFGSTRISLMQFLLGKGWRHFFAECRALSVRLGDVVNYPLPPSLHFLYPVLRFPLWLWRRADLAGAFRRKKNG